MAGYITDKLFCLDFGNKKNSVFVHAQNIEDLIRFLVSHYPDEEDIDSVKEILPDGTIHPMFIREDPLFSDLYSQKHKPTALYAGIMIIDGEPWAVRLPTGGGTTDDENEWDSILKTIGCDNSLIHFEEIYSWCQETIPVDDFEEIPGAVRRGFFSPFHWSQGNSVFRHTHSGFRPIMFPLDPVTLLPNLNYNSTRKDGSVYLIGTLYLDGVPVANPERPTWDGDIPDYIPGSVIRIGNKIDQTGYPIHWIKAGNYYIADRNLLKNISWEDLDKMGLVSGPERLKDTVLRVKSPPLNPALFNL